jgi:dynein heavy chain
MGNVQTMTVHCILAYNYQVPCTQAAIEARPLLFCSFMATSGEDRPAYAEVPSYDALHAALEAKLAEYNESNPNMDLVLFQQARAS